MRPHWGEPTRRTSYAYGALLCLDDCRHVLRVGERASICGGAVHDQLQRPHLRAHAGDEPDVARRRAAARAPEPPRIAAGVYAQLCDAHLCAPPRGSLAVVVATRIRA